MRTRGLLYPKSFAIVIIIIIVKILHVLLGGGGVQKICTH